MLEKTAVLLCSQLRPTLAAVQTVQTVRSRGSSPRRDRHQTHCEHGCCLDSSYNAQRLGNDASTRGWNMRALPFSPLQTNSWVSHGTGTPDVRGGHPAAITGGLRRLGVARSCPAPFFGGDESVPTPRAGTASITGELRRLAVTACAPPISRAGTAITGGLRRLGVTVRAPQPTRAGTPAR
jgi:hypothetical protein